VRPEFRLSRQPQIHDPQAASTPDHRQPERLLDLSDDQQALLAVLQTERHGATVRRLEARLSLSRVEVELLVEGLVERELVNRLNTLVPSYVCRHPGVDPDAG
jgi:hypothetical protein